MERAKKNKQIYLSWNSFNGGFLVAAKAIKLLAATADNGGIVIDEIIYLHDKPLSNKSIAEKRAFLQEETIGDLTKKFKDNREIKSRIIQCADIAERLDKIPKFQNHLIHIKSVTHYQSIYDELIQFIKKNINEREDIDLHINVSPGTSQMHVVWLMLNSAGFLPANAKLWSTQYVKERNKTILNPIKFKPNTLLSQVFKSGYDKKYPVNINPNETLSNKRKEVEQKILLFSAIPKAPLLLLGERGIGKSTYVRTIVRKDKKVPYAELACGIFTEELIRSELFGYEKGAFTGAAAAKKGILKRYEKGGILFLDEVHDLSKPLQRSLIQVLQTGEYYPIGANKPHVAQFKLITASNLPINELRHKLDNDFWDRIARTVVHIPPLRECREDLESYWRKSWAEMSDFNEAPPVFWNKQLEKYLYDQELEGNFRDLQKLITYLMAFLIVGEPKPQVLKKAIAEFEQWAIHKPVSLEKETYFTNGATYKEISSRFNQDLATWAKTQYGNLDNAAKILERAKSTLYEDLRGGKK